MKESRKEKVSVYLKKNKFDFLITTYNPYILYFTGFAGDTGYLIIDSDGHNTLITDSRFAIQAKLESNDDTTVIIYKKSIKEGLEVCNITENSKVVFDPDNTSYSLFKQVREYIKGVKMLPYKEPIGELLSVKDETEIGFIKKAIQISERALEETLKVIKVGMTELEVVAELEYRIKKFGGHNIAFPTIVASGKNSALPHSIPSEKKLENGELLLFDYGASYKGYKADITRTFAIGDVGDELKKVYDVVLRANKLAIAEVKSGIECKELDKLARDFISGYGYGQYFGHALGHGLGLIAHDFPPVNHRSETVLKKNMIITIEPGIYIENIGGVRIEDDIRVVNGGAEILTNFPKDKLIQI